ncbi:MAG: Ig-like domain-containing protein [Oscillospiraceae bacterium]|nr:Ig-like domain-containing protein [Oscillospiraceae bacterium]
MKIANFDHTNAGNISLTPRNNWGYINGGYDYTDTFRNNHKNFRIIYKVGSTGFTTPTWRGYPAFLEGQDTHLAVRVTGITLNNPAGLNNLLVGNSVDLTATITPADADNKRVAWESSDESVAAVGDTNGLMNTVTAVGSGTATITVTSRDNADIKATRTVTVPPVEPTGITLPSQMTILKGGTTKLTPEFVPAHASFRDVEWEALDDGETDPDNMDRVLVVNAEGFVTALEEGKATVRVTSLFNTSFTADCEITVVEKLEYKIPNENTLEYRIDYRNEVIVITGVRDENNKLFSFYNEKLPVAEYCLKFNSAKPESSKWFLIYGDTLDISNLIPDVKKAAKNPTVIRLRARGSNKEPVEIEIKPRKDIKKYSKPFIYDANLNRIILKAGTNGISHADYKTDRNEWIYSTGITTKNQSLGPDSPGINVAPITSKTVVTVRISADPDSDTPFASKSQKISIPAQKKAPKITVDENNATVKGLKNTMEIGTDRVRFTTTTKLKSASSKISGAANISDTFNINSLIETGFDRPELCGGRCGNQQCNSHYLFYIRFMIDTSKEGSHKPASDISEVFLPVSWY